MKKMIMLICLLVLAISMIGCTDDSGVNNTGRGIVDDLLFETTRFEKDLQNIVDSTCDPSLTTCDPVLR